MIKEKGTHGAIEHIGKSNLLNYNETTICIRAICLDNCPGNDDLEDH